MPRAVIYELRAQSYIANYPTNRPIFAELCNELACNPAAAKDGRGPRIVSPLSRGLTRPWTINPVRVRSGILSNFANFDKELRLRHEPIRFRGHCIIPKCIVTRALFQQIVLIVHENGFAWKLIKFNPWLKVWLISNTAVEAIFCYIMLQSANRSNNKKERKKGNFEMLAKI